jgi:CO/xanthine dehydrogenase Mo-binding subunit
VSRKALCPPSIGVDYRRVRVVSGQTDRIQYGIGAHASRASVMTGSATSPPSARARARARDGSENQRPWPADKVERWSIDR